ncbi:uncharacterized protein BDR25DRAFT_340893 [Lindgomyces ingoldianus]|uniref:Uncharacterized protein n=1 Tax=Lindgomyces ingoldianus TaxID=673940 RepID=A0ACB6R5Q4_9PLEO|nr:uncharacterized protein BDR25DRAFT_340893 [Lindgomyces ingoldianus]KAF2474420.1 hypothetical protein BDR25DRAFT_340893 [Lindgomyces ingoldianus]
MVLSRYILAASAILSLALAHAPNLGVRAAFGNQAFGIANEEGLTPEVIAEDEYQAEWAPAALSHEKNASQPLLKDRSLELHGRQLTCNPGYGYCSAFGRCCPDTTLCCSYGYCIAPADTCCPNGACDPGWGCCGSKCAPKDGDCCSDDHYCEAGNICVKLYSSGRIVCCTDLKCTAAVISGTTSYVSTTSRAAPSITAPPSTTRIVSVGGTIETWYWTVTWWYLSFYWSTSRATSTVTFTRISETTTFTTTATDETQARSLFSALSATLTFEPPSSAHTSLASLLSQQPQETGSFTLGDNFSTGFGAQPTGSSSPPGSSSSRSSTTVQPTSAGTTTAGPAAGGPSAASGVFVQWALVILGAGIFSVGGGIG